MRKRGKNIQYRKFQCGIHAGQCSNYPSISSRRFCVIVGRIRQAVSYLLGLLVPSWLWPMGDTGEELGGGELRESSGYFFFPQLYLRQCLWQQLHLFCGSSSYKSAPSSTVSASGRTSLRLQPLMIYFIPSSFNKFEKFTIH